MNWITEILPPDVQAELDAMKRAGELGLAHRRASGEIMTYVLDGWVVLEHPGMRIERVAPLKGFRLRIIRSRGFIPPARQLTSIPVRGGS